MVSKGVRRLAFRGVKAAAKSKIGKAVRKAVVKRVMKGIKGSKSGAKGLKLLKEFQSA